VLRLQGHCSAGDAEAAQALQGLLEEGWELAGLQEQVSRPAAPGDGDRVALLRSYLLSVTARDLSLILTLAEAAGSERPRVDCVRVRDKWVCFKWSVIDLDPKNLNRIPKYIEQKKLWLDAFRNSRDM
jgi:hypothetical protein